MAGLSIEQYNKRFGKQIHSRTGLVVSVHEYEPYKRVVNIDVCDQARKEQSILTFSFDWDMDVKLNNVYTVDFVYLYQEWKKRPGRYYKNRVVKNFKKIDCDPYMFPVKTNHKHVKDGYIVADVFDDSDYDFRTRFRVVKIEDSIDGTVYVGKGLEYYRNCVLKESKSNDDENQS